MIHRQVRAGIAIVPGISTIRTAQKISCEIFRGDAADSGAILSQAVGTNDVYLKLEAERPTDSFKVRERFGRWRKE